MLIATAMPRFPNNYKDWLVFFLDIKKEILCQRVFQDCIGQPGVHDYHDVMKDLEYNGYCQERYLTDPGNPYRLEFLWDKGFWSFELINKEGHCYPGRLLSDKWEAPWTLAYRALDILGTLSDGCLGEITFDFIDGEL